MRMPVWITEFMPCSCIIKCFWLDSWMWVCCRREVESSTYARRPLIWSFLSIPQPLHGTHSEKPINRANRTHSHVAHLKTSIATCRVAWQHHSVIRLQPFDRLSFKYQSTVQRSNYNAGLFTFYLESFKTSERWPGFQDEISISYLERGLLKLTLSPRKQFWSSSLGFDSILEREWTFRRHLSVLHRWNLFRSHLTILGKMGMLRLELSDHGIPSPSITLLHRSTRLHMGCVELTIQVFWAFDRRAKLYFW